MQAPSRRSTSKLALSCSALACLLLLAGGCGRLGFEVLAGDLPEPGGPGKPGGNDTDEDGGADGERDAMSSEPDASDERDAMSADNDASCSDCASCTDGLQNQDETAVDCGGAACGACPTCSDGVRNQDEIYTDCGGSACAACPACKGTFAPAERITGLDLTLPLYAPSLSADGSTLFFAKGGGTHADLYVAFRSDRGTAFSGERPVAELNSPNYEGNPTLSFDGRTLYFITDRTGTMGERDVVYATRPDLSSPFNAPVWMTSVNSASSDQTPTLSLDERTIIFTSQRAGGVGGFDLWMAQRDSRSVAFAEPVNLKEINTALGEAGPALTSDGLTLFFASDATGTLGGQDIWLTSRPDTASPFGAPQHLTVVNSAQTDQDVTITADGRELFFSSLRSGVRELWRAIRDCP